MPDHTHRFSPKTYTQPQLFACLAYMALIRADYRGVEAHLNDLPGVCEWIGIKKAPDHSTLHHAAQRFFGTGVTEKLFSDDDRQTSLPRLRFARQKIIGVCNLRPMSRLTAKHPRLSGFGRTLVRVLREASFYSSRRAGANALRPGRLRGREVGEEVSRASNRGLSG
ncbi:MAG: hypothetical protein NTW19_06235 [Planctomycetota bacterium]|nr:hypothetical protein [Planctomycetota bacterium]